MPSNSIDINDRFCGPFEIVFSICVAFANILIFLDLLTIVS